MLLPAPKYAANIKSLHIAPIKNPIKNNTIVNVRIGYLFAHKRYVTINNTVEKMLRENSV